MLLCFLTLNPIMESLYHLCLLFPLWSCRDYPYVMQSILVHYLILGITSYSKVMKIMRCNICVVFLNLDCWGKPPFNWEKLRHLLEIVKSCIIWYIMQHGLKIFIATILSFDFKIPNDLINKFRFQWTSLYYCLLSMSFITFWKFFSVWIVKNTFLPIGIVSYIDPLQTLEKHDTMLYMFSMTKWIALILSWTYFSLIYRLW